MPHQLSRLQRAVDTVCYQARLLPHRPRQWWHRLWIRRDEFHPSLAMDTRLLTVLNTEDRRRYLADLVRRRDIAHRRDMDND